MAKTCDTCRNWSNGECVADRVCWTSSDKTRRLWAAKSGGTATGLTLDMVECIGNRIKGQRCRDCQSIKYSPHTCHGDKTDTWLNEQEARLGE